MKKLINIDRHRHRVLGVAKLVVDLLLGVLAVALAFVVRLDQQTLQRAYLNVALYYGMFSFAVKGGVLIAFRVPKLAWRRAGTWDLTKLVQATLVVTMANATGAFLLKYWVNVPRSIPLLDGAFSLLLWGGVRFIARMWHESHRGGARKQRPKRRVLIVGAGEAGGLVAREMRRHPEQGLVPVGFLDDDPYKQGMVIEGVEVLGRTSELKRVAQFFEVDEIIIAMPSAPGRALREVVAIAKAAGLPYRTIPAFHELLNGTVQLSQIRPVQIEDLLRREPVRLDIQSIADYLRGKVVLVTGAGGSIGSEIVRQAGRYQPALLVLLGRGENSLFEMEADLRFSGAEFPYRVVVGDVRDRDKLEWVFATFHPKVVFHAAAHKHVPYMEYFPDEAILNNVGGTRNLVELALAYEVERFVNISTDKAVNPTSVMGASKRVAEYLVQWAATQAKPGQAFMSVRFGNVLGSRGSVVPLFKEQIRRGGPVTVTHPDMRRYFMTIPEAAQLVLQAGGLADNGAVYVLDMGEPISIVELAETLITLSGFKPYEEIEIVFTGMRPGEKLFEELLTAEEGVVASRHDKIFIARGSFPSEEELFTTVEALTQSARARDAEQIRNWLKKLIPTYHPRE